MGEHIHSNPVSIEHEFRTAKAEVLCCTHELQEVWDGQVVLMEEQDLELLEQRGGHSRKEYFQVTVKPSEPKPAKVRKCDVGDEWPMRQLCLHITVGKRAKADPESLKL